jgi:hypothetical protein
MDEDLFDALAGEVAESVADLSFAKLIVPDPKGRGGIFARWIGEDLPYSGGIDSAPNRGKHDGKGQGSSEDKTGSAVRRIRFHWRVRKPLLPKAEP